MDETRSEQLLWELSQIADDRLTETPAIELLERYREGSLDPESREAVERLLADSAIARRRLADLAGLESPGAPARSRAVPGVSPGGGWAAGRSWRLAAALVAGLVVAAGAYHLTSGARDQVAVERLAELEYQVTIEGLAEVRSPAGSTGGARAYPETVVRLRIEPAQTPVDRVEFGIYRLAENDLERVPAAPPVELTVVRGSAELVAPAAALVGDHAGARVIYIAVAAAGGLADRVSVEDGREPRQALREMGAGFVGRQAIEILARPTSEREE